MSVCIKSVYIYIYIYIYNLKIVQNIQSFTEIFGFSLISYIYKDCIEIKTEF